MVSQSLYQRAETALCRKDLAGRQTVALGFRFLGFGNASLDEAAVVLLQIIEFGQGIAGNQSIWVAGIDSRKEGIYGIIHKRLSETPCGQLRHRFVGVISLAAEGLAQNAEFVFPGKQRGKNRRRQAGGQGMKAVAFPDEAFLCFLPGGGQLHIAECLKHFHHLGIRQYSGVGTTFKYKSPFGETLYLSSRTILFFEYDYFQILLFQKKSSRQSSQSGSDNDHLGLSVLL